MSYIVAAAQYAHWAHRGQARRYTAQPYIQHPMRVAGVVTLITGVGEEEVAAAWLHDTLEDCSPQVTYNELAGLFGDIVTGLVAELTNPPKDMRLRRSERTRINREHSAAGSRWSKIIKLIDRSDNLRDMAGATLDFRTMYAKESGLLAEMIGATSPSDPTITLLIDVVREDIQWLLNGTKTVRVS